MRFFPKVSWTYWALSWNDPSKSNANAGKNARLNTLWLVLSEYSKLLASFTPFLAEEIYTNLTGGESVHLDNWPTFSSDLIDTDLNTQMQIAREAVEMAHSKRKENSIKVRQPLAKLTINSVVDLDGDVLTLVAGEVNVKEVVRKEAKELSVELDTKLTEELKAEGEARELMRQIQEERKKLGTKLDQRVNVSLPSWPKEFEEDIKKKTLIENLTQGEFRVEVI